MNVSPVRKSVWVYWLGCLGLILFMLFPGLVYASLYYQDYVAPEKPELEVFEDSLIIWTDMGDLSHENTPVQRNFLMCGGAEIYSISPYLDQTENWALHETFPDNLSHFSGVDSSKCRSFEINYIPSGDTGHFSTDIVFKGLSFKGLQKEYDFLKTLSINAFPSTVTNRLKEVGQLFVGKQWDQVVLYQKNNELKITLFRHKPIARNRTIYLNTDNWMITSVRESGFHGVTSAEAICHTRKPDNYLYVPPYGGAGLFTYKDDAPCHNHQYFKAFNFCRRERRNGRVFLWHALQDRTHEPSSGFLAVKSRTTHFLKMI